MDPTGGDSWVSRFHPPESHWEEGTEQHTGQDDLTLWGSQPASFGCSKSLQLAMSGYWAGQAETGFEPCMKGQRGCHVTKADGAMDTPGG